MGVLRGLGLHDQGLAVMLLLRDAVTKGVIDRVGWQRLKDYYRRNWHRPLPQVPQVL